MTVSIIAAMGKQREIGYQNQLLWRLPNDMKFFRTTTMGKPILVGRKTYESFGGKPLPGRKNIVITKDTQYQAPGATVVHTVEDALAAAEPAEEIMVIGGASFYEQLLPKADRLYITYVDGEFTADSWFPAFDLSQWQVVQRELHEADEKNPYQHEFVIFDRIQD